MPEEKMNSKSKNTNKKKKKKETKSKVASLFEEQNNLYEDMYLSTFQTDMKKRAKFQYSKHGWS